MTKGLRLILAGLLAAALVGSGAAPASASPSAPDFPTAYLYSQANPLADPPGANDWSCRPSAAHPRPVVLVHGTWLNKYDDFAKISPELKKAGYCVYALNYGASLNLLGLNPALRGTGDIRRSAGELSTFVDRVLAGTGASKVDIVGHSQGGLMPRQYLKFNGGADRVHTLVTLGATHHGTTLDGLGTLTRQLGIVQYGWPLLGVAAEQQVVGSAFLNTLNAGGDTVPGVTYVVIATKYDEVTTPYESTFLTAGPAATVRNITLQDGCAIDASDHLSMVYSPRAIGIVEKALDASAPAPPCTVNPPVA
ncbi:lipase family alpha/beta hydrolase [Fodinicola acaciae]|uniref:lipase family alpha/beta hydrolase n=1 Tax=Fodinicola acaciae TaxID=2681555 RepID=UPI0013D3B166|nr:alpha/beta fold hydrolase [Fodinicola acaciae]